MKRARNAATRRHGNKGGTGRASRSRLDRLIEEATIDCYDREEQVSGFYSMLEECLAVPFETEVLGMSVVVTRIGMNSAGEIVSICRRSRFQQAIPVLDLPLPPRRPRGVEWIEAYRRWACGG